MLQGKLLRVKECGDTHMVTLLEGRDSWRELLGSPEEILVSSRACACAGLFTTSL